MKIKCLPEDFVVEEFLNFPESSPVGKYQLYKLEKSGLSTLDIINLLVRKYRIPDREISFAGLKDKHALTYQYLSVRGSSPKEIKERNFTLALIDKVNSPITSDLLVKNRFEITLRDLEKASLSQIVESLEQVSKSGFPNYFGEQRFGSIRHGAGFFTKCLLLGDFEQALKLHLAYSSTFDKSSMREFKEFVYKNWGNWDACFKAATSHEDKAIFSHLKKYPKDYVRAVNLINPRMLFLYIAAYQSYIWNEMVSQFIKTHVTDADLINFQHLAGEMLFYKKPDERLLEKFRNTDIPLLDHKVKFKDEEIERIAEHILKTEGFAISNLKLDKIKKAFFKSTHRELVVFPEDLEISKPADDELYPEKSKLTFSFFLPPGSYASVLIRRIGVDIKEGESVFD